MMRAAALLLLAVGAASGAALAAPPRSIDMLSWAGAALAGCDHSLQSCWRCS